MINKDKIIYNTLILGTLIVVIFFSIRYSSTDLFKCHNLIITGCSLSNEMNIKNQFEYLKNESIFNINNHQIITKLINNDFISSANVITIIPNTIIINISEIVPIGIVKINNNSFLIDEYNNGYLYNDNPSSNIQIPRIYTKNIINIEDVFEGFEYRFIQNIYSNYHSLYVKISHLENLNDKLLVFFDINSKSNKVYFNLDDYSNQIQYLDSFFEILDEINQEYYYEYIKFAGETIIVKERNI
tara:strand:- start:774 stop:1502 length:729 start_codon:yes stop_codon:yes gene_type:complete